MDLEVGDIVMCTVERIGKTIVFVKLEDGKEGHIMFSEIAPGRIRNIRDYVVPKKKIVCKILRISGSGNIDLSLRRVTQKEKKEVLEQFSLEKSYKSILKSILKEETEKTVKEIQKKENLLDFLNKAKEKPAELEKLIGKEKAKKILDILKAQKPKKAILKKEISLVVSSPGGLNFLKQILGKIKDAKVNYISAGNYTITTEAEDIKKADQKMKEIFSEIEEESKKTKAEFSVKEKQNSSKKQNKKA